MSDLIANVSVAFALIAFVALIVATIRTSTGASGAYPLADLVHRAYGA